MKWYVHVRGLVVPGGPQTPPALRTFFFTLATAPSVTLASLSSDLSETSSVFPCQPSSSPLPPSPAKHHPSSSVTSCLCGWLQFSVPACSSLQNQGLPLSLASLRPNYSAPPNVFCSAVVWGRCFCVGRFCFYIFTVGQLSVLMVSVAA